MNFDMFWSDLLAGVAVALVAGLIALVVAKWITGPLEETRSRAAQNAAAAGDFYQAYGGFFAAWKGWAAFKSDAGGGQRTPTNEQWIALLARVTDAEGALESFLMRFSLERPLTEVDVARLWCFRQGYKELRHAVRDGRALGWRRSDDTEPHQHGMYMTYSTFKRLALDVATLLTAPPMRRETLPNLAVAWSNFQLMTGSKAPAVFGSEAIDRPDWADPAAKPGSWEWVVRARSLEA